MTDPLDAMAADIEHRLSAAGVTHGPVTPNPAEQHVTVQGLNWGNGRRLETLLRDAGYAVDGHALGGQKVTYRISR